VKKKLIISFAVVFAILVIDQIVKIWVKTTLKDEAVSEIEVTSFFKINYVENQGMAFGTSFGASVWAKYGLSIFRIIAIVAIVMYMLKQARANVRTEFLIAIGLVLAGATGNLIDSMLYDYIFPFDPCDYRNQLPGSGNFVDCALMGKMETRHSGFLLASVVDMYHFTAEWPSWVPWYDKSPMASNQIFPAIWNTADAAISIGVVMIIIRQRKYFPKKVAVSTANTTIPTEVKTEEPNAETTNNNPEENV
jgi:signal peptidase II